MILLDLTFINSRSPYTVWKGEGFYSFYSEYGILYSVEFEKDYFGGNPVYWFNLTNRSSKASPNDRNVQATIVCIIEEFFRSNTDVILYMCDTADNQQAMRARLFSRWFNTYEAKQSYIMKTAIVETEGQQDFVVLIVSPRHPHAKLIAELFDAEVSALKAHKP